MDDVKVKQLTNRVVLTINALLSSFLAVGYTLEYFKGARELSYVLFFVAVVVIPIMWAIIAYQRNKDGSNIKYITLVGYLVVYTIALVTSTSQLAFVYIFPIIVMYLLYFNLKLTVYSYSYVFLLNIGVIAYKAIFVGVTTKETTDLTIQFAAITLFGVSIILATRLSNLFNFSKINNIKGQQQKQEEILSKVMGAANVLEANAKDLQSFMTQFNMSMDQVTGAIDEISRGAQDTSENMTEQSNYCSKINDVIESTSVLSQQMGELSRNSSEEVNQGLRIVNLLNEKATIVNEQSGRVGELILELKNKTDEILGITSIIEGISGQTNLLSLNASIEAARAGEAGKGFAVVADEIRQLADQSRQSSSKISKIINDLNVKVTECVEQIESTKDANLEQNEYIVNTKKVYEDISRNTSKLSQNIEEVTSKISTIVNSNQQIKEGINRIAAVSQQTAASSQEANAMASENKQSAEQLLKKINEIMETSQKMKKYAD